MDLLKHLTTKMFLEAVPASPKEHKVHHEYHVRVEFPDDDKWCYVTHEKGLLEGQLMTFQNHEEAQIYLKPLGIDEFTLEKIK